MGVTSLLQPVIQSCGRPIDLRNYYYNNNSCTASNNLLIGDDGTTSVGVSSKTNRNKNGSRSHVNTEDDGQRQLFGGCSGVGCCGDGLRFGIDVSSWTQKACFGYSVMLAKEEFLTNE